MNKTYFCRMGNHHATLEEMKSDTISGLGNGKCKKCHSQYNSRRQRLAAGTVVAVALFGEDLFLSVYEFVDFWTQVIKEWHE